MPTLQDLRKAKYKTTAVFAIAYGCSIGVCNALLKGLHHNTLSRKDIEHLAEVLGVSFDACVAAENASYKEYIGTQRPYQSLQEQWEQRDMWASAAFKGAKFDDWSEWEALQQKEREEFQRRSSAFSTPSSQLDSLALLGLSHNATHTQIKEAFRQKVKDASDGQGGYNVDMDKLVQAKEQALAQCK